MDSISKVSADYSLELTESHSIRILLCYLLKKLEKPISPQQLYEIAVGNNIINYFYYTEAIEELVKNKTILIENNESGQFYVLAEKGKYGTDEFKQYVPKTFREKLLGTALKYFAEQKKNSDVKCELIKLEKGYNVNCVILDLNDKLMELNLFAPDEEQAQLIKNQIMLNPTDFYGKIIGFALGNKEYEPEIEDV